MRILALAGLTMVTVLGAGAADAQRLGGAGASYPMPGRGGMQQPGGGAPITLPPPPMIHTGPTPGRPFPGQSYPGRPNPGQSYPGRPVPGSYPKPNPGGYPSPNPGQYPKPYPGGYPKPNPGSYPMPNPGSYPRPNPGYHNPGSRWGNKVGGRWYGGSYAPGGWNAYHRPSRGWQVPNYWISPNFYLNDYASYGLSTPPQDYGWYRYYDDAVLLDARGQVYDSRGGIDWDGGSAYAEGGAGGYATSDYGYSDDGYGESRGGYAGDAYRDDRPGYDAPPPRAPYGSLPPVVRSGGVTTYSTGGYAGYAYPGATTTVITIQPSETVTTTTTEYVEETRYVAPRRVYHAPRKRVYRPKCTCKRVVRYVEKPILGS